MFYVGYRLCHFICLIPPSKHPEFVLAKTTVGKTEAWSNPTAHWKLHASIARCLHTLRSMSKAILEEHIHPCIHTQFGIEQLCAVCFFFVRHFGTCLCCHQKYWKQRKLRDASRTRLSLQRILNGFASKYSIDIFLRDVIDAKKTEQTCYQRLSSRFVAVIFRPTMEIRGGGCGGGDGGRNWPAAAEG